MSSERPAQVTKLLDRWSGGDRSCEDELFDAVYAELAGIARSHLRRERPGHTLEPAALVHEAYIRLRDAEQEFSDRIHFFAIASRVMRRLLIDHGRARSTAKRGGAVELVTLEAHLRVSDGPSVDAARLEAALARLEALDPQKARFVEMRHLAGLSTSDIAKVAGVTPRTVRRGLEFARAFIRRELAE